MFDESAPAVGQNKEVSDDHDVLLVMVPVRKSLVPDLDLGEVEAAGLGAGAAAGDGADGQAVPEEGAVDLPGPQARAKTPNVLKIRRKSQLARSGLQV